MMSESSIVVRDPNMEKLNIKDLVKDKKFLKDVNFLNHIGYFCHDPKKAKGIKDPQTYMETTTIQGERVEMVYKVLPNPAFGYPSVTAYNICDFIDRVLVHYGRPAMNPVPYDMVSLRAFLDVTKTGPNNQTIINALHQLKSTIIQTSHFFLDRKRKWIKTSYSIIDKLVFIGEEENDVKAGLIYLNKDIIESFNNKNHMPVNYDRYGDLPTPTKVLYLKLFRAFSAARKSGKTSGEITAENDYDALCRALGFTPKKHKSRIKQQLKPHLVTLQDIKKLVKSWDIKKKKNKKGFKLSSKPGEGFDEDHENFNNKHDQLELPFNKRDNKTVEEIEAVRYFHEKLFGIDSANIQETSHVSSREIAMAKEILKKFPGKRICKFIDYAIEEAKRTGFAIKTFNGLEGFINDFIGKEVKKKKAKKIKESQERVKNKEQEARHLYRQFIDETYNDYLKGLNAKERKEHEQTIHDEVISSSLCRSNHRKTEPSFKETPIYTGIETGEIERFIETNLIKENDFKEWLKKQGKEYLSEIRFK